MPDATQQVSGILHIKLDHCFAKVQTNHRTKMFYWVAPEVQPVEKVEALLTAMSTY